MKKFVIITAIAALTIVGSHLGKTATEHTDGLSDIELANAEALADGNESGSMITWPCWKKVDKFGGGVWLCDDVCIWEEYKKGIEDMSKCVHIVE